MPLRSTSAGADLIQPFLRRALTRYRKAHCPRPYNRNGRQGRPHSHLGILPHAPAVRHGRPRRLAALVPTCPAPVLIRPTARSGASWREVRSSLGCGLFLILGAGHADTTITVVHTRADASQNGERAGPARLSQRLRPRPRQPQRGRCPPGGGPVRGLPSRMTQAATRAWAPVSPGVPLPDRESRGNIFTECLP